MQIAHQHQLYTTTTHQHNNHQHHNNHHQYYNNHQQHHQKPLYEFKHYNYKLNINQCNYNNLLTKPYNNSSSDYNNYNNHTSTTSAVTAYTEFPEKPIKMQREEIIIEHSQLVLNGENGTTNENGVHQHRSHHYTQVIVYPFFAFKF